MDKRINNMKFTCLLMVFILCVLTWPMVSSAQERSNAETQAPLLALDEAVTLALQHNRLVKNSVLEAQKYDFQVSTARSRRKPQFQFSMLGGEFLQPFDFTYPGRCVGHVSRHWANPSNEAKVHTPAVFTTYLTGSIDQPLDTTIQDRSRNSRDGTGTRYRSGRCAC